MRKNNNINVNEISEIKMDEFTHEIFGMIYGITIDNKPYFWGTSIASALGYQDPTQAVRYHVNKQDKLTRWFNGTGQYRKYILINESGLFSLILRSRLSAAQEFRHWITSEVIPSIMHKGFYINPKANISTSQNELFDKINIEEYINYKYPNASNISRSNFFSSLMVLEESHKLNFKTEKINRIPNTPNNNLLPSHIVTSENVLDFIKPNPYGYYNITSIAKLYNKTGQWLNNVLNANGIQFKNKLGVWELYDKHKNKGYTHTVSFFVYTPNGKQEKVNMYWTATGVKAIVEYLKNKGCYIERK